MSLDGWVVATSSRCGGCGSVMILDGGDVLLCPNDDCSWEDPVEDEIEAEEYAETYGHDDADQVAAIWGGR